MTTTEQSYATSPQLVETLKKYQHIATFVGLIFLAFTAAGISFSDPSNFCGRIWWVSFSGSARAWDAWRC